MDRDDPEQRIADLERQLAEQKRGAGLPSASPGALDARPAAPGEAIRCLLVPNLASAMFKGQRQRASVPVAMDVGKDAIWLFRSNTNAPIASAWLSQVTATPANLAASTSMGTTMTMPLLVVRVPGLLPLTIGVGGAGPDVGSWTYRFSWRGSVQGENSPVYFVSLAEWLALVDKLGLAPYLEDKAGAQPNGDGREWTASMQPLQQANAAWETWRRRRWLVVGLVLATVFGGPALFMIGSGAWDFYQYHVGTPTTATIVRCTASRNANNCYGTWSVGGESHTGPIAGAGRGLRIGSSVDVRVRGDTAYTAATADWHFYVNVFSFPIFLIGLFVILFVLRARRRRRTGR